MLRALHGSYLVHPSPGRTSYLVDYSTHTSRPFTRSTSSSVLPQHRCLFSLGNGVHESLNPKLPRKSASIHWIASSSHSSRNSSPPPPAPGSRLQWIPRIYPPDRFESHVASPDQGPTARTRFLHARVVALARSSDGSEGQGHPPCRNRVLEEGPLGLDWKG